MAGFTTILADVYHNGGGHMGGWGGGWMWLWGVAMMVLFGSLVIWLVRGTSQASVPRPPDPTDRAKQILAERFANGDLSTEEYRERVTELQ
jgi:putative membrane protein